MDSTLWLQKAYATMLETFIIPGLQIGYSFNKIMLLLISNVRQMLSFASIPGLHFQLTFPNCMTPTTSRSQSYRLLDVGAFNPSMHDIADMLYIK